MSSLLLVAGYVAREGIEKRAGASCKKRFEKPLDLHIIEERSLTKYSTSMTQGLLPKRHNNTPPPPHTPLLSSYHTFFRTLH